MPAIDQCRLIDRHFIFTTESSCGSGSETFWVCKHHANAPVSTDHADNERRGMTITLIPLVAYTLPTRNCSPTEVKVNAFNLVADITRGSLPTKLSYPLAGSNRHYLRERQAS